uniref:Antimicrobial peptide PEN2-2 n=1 Tax=Penaeus paulensis TaxID=71413 RepID=Q56H83_PENPU|nr:antimicrobial peptide PEN2-2 [Penaeus paulensis]
MRLVVCLVFLASFALVCQGHGYKGGYTRPFSRPPFGGIYGPVRPACNACYSISFSDALNCCTRFGRCCQIRKG